MLCLCPCSAQNKNGEREISVLAVIGSGGGEGGGSERSSAWSMEWALLYICPDKILSFRLYAFIPIILLFRQNPPENEAILNSGKLFGEGTR